MSLIPYVVNVQLAQLFPEFSALNFKGSWVTPLFDVKQVQGMLKMKQDEYPVIADGKCAVEYEGVVCFTERGLLEVLCASKTDLAEQFKDFLFVALKDFCNDHYQKRLQKAIDTVSYDMDRVLPATTRLPNGNMALKSDDNHSTSVEEEDDSLVTFSTTLTSPSLSPPSPRSQ